jgi:hypothetical protein
MLFKTGYLIDRSGGTTYGIIAIRSTMISGSELDDIQNYMSYYVGIYSYKCYWDEFKWYNN